MIIGNDIVDLNYWLPLNKAANPRYIAKICSREEQATLARSKDANLLLMRFWSMKEAAYKVAVKLGAERAFIPKRLECEILDENWGEVQSEYGRILIFSDITEDYIHSVAADSPFEIAALHPALLKLDSKETVKQSKLVRRALLSAIATKLELDIDSLQLCFIDDVPRLKLRGKLSEIELSMSHDGTWGAFVFTF